MKNSLDFIRSGILEQYVLGLASDEEKKEVEEMATAYTEVREAIDEISIATEKHALENAVKPPARIKPFVMAVVDFMSRMQKGEAPGFPPELSEDAKISDYAEWLDRPDMVLPPGFADDTFAKIIGYTPQIMTAIVWLKEMAPDEEHKAEYEKFLIVEGTCTIVIGDTAHDLTPGDYLTIPLFENHYVKVTSEIPCKLILQRVAA